MSCPETYCGRRIWPSNTTNEILYGQQRLFNVSNHNHDQVLGEKRYNLPLMIPENQAKAPFQYCSGDPANPVMTAPYSSDNVMHTQWEWSRLGTNLNTPWGSDSNIYFDQVPPAGQFNAWKDWLDQPKKYQTVSDQAISQCCERVKQTGAKGEEGKVCTPTCVDWWTNRIVNPQGSLQNGNAVSGGCPFGTVRALTCYPCHVHQTYTKAAQ